MEIRYFDPKNIDLQLQLTTNEVKKWTYFHIRYKDELLLRYSGENYRKEQNIYLFDDEELVGFTEISFLATPKGTSLVHFPVVKHDGRESEYIDILMQEIKQILKKYEFPLPIMRIGHDWTDIELFTSTYDLSYHKDFGQFTLFDLKTDRFDQLGKSKKLAHNTFQYKIDDSELINLLAERTKLPAEQIESYLMNTRKSTRLVEEIAYKPKNHILAYGTINQHEVDQNFGYMGHVYVFNNGDDEIRSKVTVALLERARNRGITRVSLNSPSSVIDPNTMYRDLNQKFSQFSIWKFDNL